MNLQRWLDRIVADHRPSCATLRYDLERVIPKVAAMYKPWFEDPRDVHGLAFCANVRLLVLRERELRGPMPGDTLLSSCGSGLSVQLSDSRGMDFRLRRWPSRVLHGERVRMVITPGGGQHPMAATAAAPGEQMTLDEGAQTRLFPAPTSTPMGKPDIAALWWPTKDGYGLAEAELAAVIDIDNASRVQILASTPLPPVTESPLLLGPPPAPIVPTDDFGEWAPPSAASGTDDPDQPEPA
ncbi:hypothetical protein PJI21_26080 [Mycobacterium kansasii]|uniref:Uncharacterized protein n=3 Tax=Mycobacterium TaxID=1763 RepID=A0A1A3NIN3_MYCAS|nr:MULTISPECIES: hypothetical protein [Mycobacterium]MBI2702631.1 hypothetical protein [Mycobacterium sp.]AYE98112.1 hypothetical protein C0J29_28290 [Mycobacterium paragordonae]MDP7725743.1 hypothetical protein [Mycobacterium sp. TY814]MDP7739156.1 hypothetical protein [Mycobacterium paragordonae]OBI90845.1 hypothetical protein A9X01_10960 [Mycobacterium asiaticum]